MEGGVANSLTPRATQRDVVTNQTKPNQTTTNFFIVKILYIRKEVCSFRMWSGERVWKDFFDSSVQSADQSGSSADNVFTECSQAVLEISEPHLKYGTST